jgi:hypothetical protein
MASKITYLLLFPFLVLGFLSSMIVSAFFTGWAMGNFKLMEIFGLGEEEEE